MCHNSERKIELSSGRRSEEDVQLFTRASATAGLDPMSSSARNESWTNLRLAILLCSTSTRSVVSVTQRVPSAPSKHREQTRPAALVYANSLLDNSCLIRRPVSFSILFTATHSYLTCTANILMCCCGLFSTLGFESPCPHSPLKSTTAH
jgi:hypothetical protein